MSELTITSTSDTPEDVAAALGVEDEEIEIETPGEDPPAEDPPAGSDEQPPKEDEEQPPVAASGTDKDKKEEPPKKTADQETIERLNREKFETDRQLNELRRQLAERNEKPPEKKEEPKPPVLAARPTQNDTNPDGTPKYKTWGELNDAVSKWHEDSLKVAREEDKANLAAQFDTFKKEFNTAQERQRQATAMWDAWQARRKEGAELYTEAGKDWATVVDKSTLNISETMKQLMLTHPMGHHLAYWYGSNPAEVARIAALHPEVQKLELGYIIKTLKIPQKASGTVTTVIGEEGGRKKSNAPKPMKTKPGANGHASATVKDYKYYESLDYAAFKAARESGELK